MIVTRHAGLVAWLEARGIAGTVIAQATPADVQGKRVIGALPLHLAAIDMRTLADEDPNDRYAEPAAEQRRARSDPIHFVARWTQPAATMTPPTPSGAPHVNQSRERQFLKDAVNPCDKPSSQGASDKCSKEQLTPTARATRRPDAYIQTKCTEFLRYINAEPHDHRSRRHVTKPDAAIIQWRN